MYAVATRGDVTTILEPEFHTVRNNTDPKTLLVITRAGR
jgi:hypothetical protein